MGDKDLDSKTDLLRAAEAAVEPLHQPGGEPTWRRSRPSVLVGGLLLVGAVGGWVVVARPSWVIPPAEVASAPEVLVATMRLALVRERDRVERFREANGRLPATLAEAGSPLPNAQIATAPDGSYLLRIVEGGAALELHSRDDVDAFLGRSLEVIRSTRGTP